VTTTALTSPLRRLRAELSGTVLGPGDAGYDDARMVFAATVDRRPTAIARPMDDDDVAAVVSIARDSGLELAVRSGGHSPAGHGATEGGIVLDLGDMKALEIDPGARVAWAETGLTAGEVTDVAGASGLAVPFGDSGVVGIGGLTLGGGAGLLVRKHGLTIDSLLGAEVVTADGKLVHADDAHNPDLFWAIRGGGGNFGVATRFRYRLHQVGVVLAGMLVLPATAETIAGFVAAADEAPVDVSAVVTVRPAPPLPFVPAEQHGRLVLMATIVHAGAVDEADADLAAFRGLAAPIVDALRPTPYPEVFPAGPVPRMLAAARTMFVDGVDTDAAAEMLARLHASTALAPVVQMRVLGGAVARVPASATAFAHRSSRVMLNVGAIYATPDEAPVHEAWIRAAADALIGADSGAYVNFLGDEGPERVRSAYPGRTWDRLVEVKRRYDPENLFRLNQNVPPEEVQR
jgi:hypothetical protein